MTSQKEKSRKFIENIILNGSKEEKKALYQFNNSMSVKEIAKRFNLFVVGNFVRYYSNKPAPFHQEMIENYIRAYSGQENFLNIGFRGCAKTSLLKLFITYTLLNDEDKKRNYIKVVTKDTVNSKQIVTDIYNHIVELSPLYGDLFEKEGRTKKEESMTTFTLKTGAKLGSGTVGQVQRGQVQDAFRPDFVWFEDIEDSSTIKSMVQTSNIIAKIDEAIQGMSDNGNYVVTANYISEEGTVEWFKSKKGITTMITPIIKDEKPSWDKYTLEKIQKIKDDAEDFEGDFLCDPTSGKDKFFDIDIARKMLEQCEEPIKEVDASDMTKIKIWEEYKDYHTYGLGGDTAEGIGEDSNAMTLWNFSSNTVIGTYHSNLIAPDMFGYEMAKVGSAYGGCLVAPERNNCFDEKTEVLTDEGWKLFKDLNKKESVATLNIDNRKIEFQKPTNYIEKESDVMYKFKQGKTDLCIDEEHRILYEKRNGEIEFTNVKEILNKGNKQINFIHSGKFETNTSVCDDWLTFLAYFIADGNCSKKVYKGREYYSFMLYKTVGKKAMVKKFRDIFSKIGLHHWEKNRKVEKYSDGIEFHFSDKRIYKYLRENVGVGQNKRIPDFIFNLNYRQRSLFLDKFIECDGHIRTRVGKPEKTYYAGKSKFIADQVQTLLLLNNKASVINSRGEIKEHNSNKTYFRTNRIERIDYKGKAYCVSVPNKTLIVRRNGKPIIMGNTGHATISALKQIEYYNIYKEVITNELLNKQTEKLGWNTNRQTKPQMWSDFKKDFNDGVIKIKCSELLEEIIKYTKADYNERTQGIITRHFDLLTSAVIGWQLKKIEQQQPTSSGYKFKSPSYV